jgi:purine-nucleoside phosphorylase
MLISDHLNIVQRTPLFGEPGDQPLRRHGRGLRRHAARPGPGRRRGEAGITLHEGVYAWLLGPQFETPAEIRMAAAAGRAGGGHEHRARDHPGPPRRAAVLGLSLLTNMAAGMDAQNRSATPTRWPPPRPAKRRP